MKKKFTLGQRTVILYFFAAALFYIASIANFIGHSRSTAVMFLCLGSAMLCFGAARLNLMKKDEADKKDREKK